MSWQPRWRLLPLSTTLCKVHHTRSVMVVLSISLTKYLKKPGSYCRHHVTDKCTSCSQGLWSVYLTHNMMICIPIYIQSLSSLCWTSQSHDQFTTWFYHARHIDTFSLPSDTNSMNYPDPQTFKNKTSVEEQDLS